MIGDRGWPVRPQAAQMGRDQLAAMEDLHRLGRDARLHLLAQQPERHRVELDLNSGTAIPAVFLA
jgi:hypothetical protein